MFNESIDVIIPTFNREKYIKRSILSVLNQTYKNVKVYVIDDDSTDETEKVIRGIQDNRIFYYKNKKNMGANYCRNYGMSISDSKYIAFNDSDDVWKDNKLEKQYEMIQSSYSMVFSPYVLIENDKRNVIGVCNDEEINNISSRLLRGNVIGTPTILMTRDLIRKKGGFDECLSRFQDWEFCIRLSKEADVFYYKYPLVDAYRVSNSITKDRNSTRESMIYIAQRYSCEIKERGLVSDWLQFALESEYNPEELGELLDTFNLSQEEKEREYASAINKIYCNGRKTSEYLELTAALLQKGRKIVDLFNGKQIISCCVYGNSITGRALAAYLMSEGISVDCFIDKYNSVNEFVKVIRPDEYRIGVHSGVVINTVPSFDDEISEMFGSSKVITISDLNEL